MGRPKIDKSDWVCEVCGVKYGVVKSKKFEKINGIVYCPKHAAQIRKYGKILPRELERNRVGSCCICGEKGIGTWTDGKDYCRKHYLQMSRHGHILERTIFDRNEYIDHPNENYAECVLYDKTMKEVGRTLIDLEDKDEVSRFKVYKRTNNSKEYAIISLGNGEKLLLHRYIMGIRHRDYKLSECVDHINGNGLDNRKENLRVCEHSENMKNIRKGSRHISGVQWLRENEKWSARVTYNYKAIHLGNYDLFEEAAYARIKGEKEYFGDFGPLKNYYYVLESRYPIEEIKKIDFKKPQQRERNSRTNI